jgi:hypothetical protein
MRRVLLLTLFLTVTAGPALGEPRRIDPAVEQFWSDRCVQQRRDRNRPHTKDCDNPAYSGGYRARDPYRHHQWQPYGHGSGWGLPQWRGPEPERRRSGSGGSFRYPSLGPSGR